MTFKILVGLTAALLSTAASANSKLVQGTFAYDNDKASTGFTLDKASTVQIETYSYAGANNAFGTFAAGGFDPILSVYDLATGLLVASNDDGSGVPLDATTGHGGDSLLWLTNLAAGNYRVYLTQYSNFGPIVLGNDFAFDGVPDFRGGFVDAYGSQRTGDYAFSVSGASSVPEATSISGLLAGLGLLGIAMRPRRTR